MRSVAAIAGYYGISYHMSFNEHATRDCRRVSIKIEFIKHVLYFILMETDLPGFLWMWN